MTRRRSSGRANIAGTRVPNFSLRIHSRQHLARALHVVDAAFGKQPGNGIENARHIVERMQRPAEAVRESIVELGVHPDPDVAVVVRADDYGRISGRAALTPHRVAHEQAERRVELRESSGLARAQHV